MSFRFAPLLLLLLPCCPVAGQLNVYYTGRTLGYLRFPDVQTRQDTACPGDVKEMNSAATLMFAKWKTQRDNGEVLVGMGDNLGPDLFSRTFASTRPAAGPPASPFLAKDLFEWTGNAWVRGSANTQAAGSLPADNVGCFLREMHYAALTPGKHDFDAGPERLRQMARFLQSPRSDGKPGPTLLAANLSVATAAPDARPPQAAYLIERDLKNNTFTIRPPVHEDDPAPSVTFPDVVLPFLRRFEVSNAYFLRYAGGTRAGSRVIPGDFIDPRKLYTTPAAPFLPPSPMIPAPPNMYLVYTPDPGGASKPAIQVVADLRIDGLRICREQLAAGVASRSPYGFTPPGPFGAPAPAGCDDIPPATDVDPGDFATGKISFQIGHEFLRPDTNYAACLHLVGNGLVQKKAEYYCKPFYVAEPFFDYSMAGAHSGDPFVVVDAPGAGKVAIFGLLDQDLQGKIGRLNYAYWNQDQQHRDKPKYETAAQITGLADALKQALMRCELRPACIQSDHRILLAQMPTSRATQFVATLTDPFRKGRKANPAANEKGEGPMFDLVVAETDANNKTPAGSVSRTVDAKASSGFVVVSDEMYAPGKLNPQIGKAQVSATLNGSDKLDWKLSNSSIDAGKSNIPMPAEAGTQSCGLPMPAGAKPSLRCLALQTLQYLHVTPDAGVSNFDSRWNSSQILQRLAMIVMQQEPHRGDVSLLQARDLFRPEVYGAAAVTDDNLQELLDRLFWKGDYAFRVPVNGATLTSILKAGDDFSTAESNPTTTDLEKGRSLLTLGVFKESADQSLTVNGTIAWL
jgi:hypothetical protein